MPGRRMVLGKRTKKGEKARVKTPIGGFDVVKQHSLRPFKDATAVWQILSKVGRTAEGKLDLEHQSARRLVVLAGMAVENPALKNLTYGKKRSSVFAGNLWENLEKTWLMYNHRLSKKKAGKLGEKPLVTPKEANALRQYLGILWQRLSIKLEAEGLK